MLNKNNIGEIIEDHEIKIQELLEAKKDVSNELAKNAIQNEINFLVDNQARYKMQARAWGV